MDKPLDIEVRDLLESRRGEWQRVAEGAGVSHSWISQFVRGKIPNPGYATLVALRDFLTDEAKPTTTPDPNHPISKMAAQGV
jgi:transcriptional regulator with XRE-family HTH domain